MIRTKGEAGSGNIVEAVRHLRALTTGVRRLAALGAEEPMAEAKALGAPYDLVRWVAATGGCRCRTSPPAASPPPPTRPS